jgi:hypothetical protein
MGEEMNYQPGMWIFGQFATIVYGWESPKATDKNDDERCRLPQAIYDKLPGGHEHEGNRLYKDREEAMKALAIALQ